MHQNPSSPSAVADAVGEDLLQLLTAGVGSGELLRRVNSVASGGKPDMAAQETDPARL
jgi:hypothetical protein